VEGENPADHALINRGAESQVDLIRNLEASPGRIASFHLDDSADQIGLRAFGTWFCSPLWRKQQLILALNQGAMKAQQRGCFKMQAPL
jgi:hypothetical protein